MIEKFIKNLPFYSLLLLTSGLINIIFYYSSFNLNILHYIELSEIFSLLVNDIVTFSLLIAVVFTQSISINRYYSIAKEKRDWKDKFTMFASFIIFSFPCIVLLYAVADQHHLTVLNNHYYLLIIVLGVFIKLIEHFYSFYKSKLDKVTYHVLAATLAFNLYSIPVTWRICYALKNDPSQRNISLDYGTKQLLPFQDQIYLGKTKFYFFIYDTKEKSSVVYPITELKCIKVYNNEQPISIP